MKYLIINGSAHKGNTWKLAELVKNRLSETDAEVIFEEIHLADIKLPFCCGCSNCFRIGHEKCPHFPIIDKVIKAIENADGVIVTSATFNMKETTL